MHERPESDPTKAAVETFRKEKHGKWDTPPEVIDDVVIEATGSPVARIERVINGETNEIYFIEAISGEEVVVRIFHGEKTRFEKERWALEQSAKAGVPVPKMLYVGSRSEGDKPLQICVESKLKGVGLDQVPDITLESHREERDELLHDVGRNLGKVHSVKTNGFGMLDKEGNGKFKTVEELISGDQYIDKTFILSALSNRPDDMDSIKKAYEILERESTAYADTESSLVHNDLSPQHILVDEGKVSGMIDFESAVGGDPLIDFALWDVKYNSMYPTEAIKEGYEDQTLFSGDYEKRLNFWKIYRSLTRLRYNINEKKEFGIDSAIKGIREGVAVFEQHD